MNRIFTLFVVAEIIYVIAVRLLVHTYGEPWPWTNLELHWSLLRFLSIGALIWMYRRLEPARQEQAGNLPPNCLWAAGMFLAPLLAGEMGLQGSDRYVFAATGLLVGIREELAYRGILQRFLTRKYGLIPSLAVSNFAFVWYHFGIQPFSLHAVLQIFLCGVVFGLVYHISDNIILAIALHTIYDGIDAFTPFFTPRMPDYVCTIVGLATLAVLVLANRKSIKLAMIPPPA